MLLNRRTTSNKHLERTSNDRRVIIARDPVVILRSAPVSILKYLIEVERPRRR